MRLILIALVIFAQTQAGALANDPPQTAAERSGYAATTSHNEVLSFLEWASQFDRVHRASFGRSYEGRDLPLLIVGMDDPSPESILADDRLRVLVLANIHAGEVAGKEASLMIIRDLVQQRERRWADHLVLMFAPNFNADGNERIDPRNRPLQHGPTEGMGTRSNAQGLNINRDFEKLDTPEGRAFADLMNRFDPHLVMDLHTTNGTVHAYHLTYAPPLHPLTDAAIDEYLRGSFLPSVQDSMLARGFRSFDYGNDKPEWGQPPGWATFDPRPRFLTNYVGVRNRLAILSEAYSYSTFQERIEVTRAFVEAILDHAALDAHAIRSLTERADESRLPEGSNQPTRSAGQYVAEDEPATILLGGKTIDIHPLTGEPMWRRTDQVIPTEMTAYLRFAGSDSVAVPEAYLIPVPMTDVIERLEAHGVVMERVELAPSEIIERFAVHEVTRSERPFEGRHVHEIVGNYAEAAIGDHAGAFMRAPIDQPLGRLLFLLLEPRSDAGFASWGLIDLDDGVSPILRQPAAEPTY